MPTTGEPRIVISKNGPYLVQGPLPVAIQAIVPDEKGDSREWKEGATIPTSEKYALCRCGGSAKKPFCDGTHARSGFDGTETASKGSYDDEANAIDGPTLLLTDKSSLCAGARFCDPDPTIWRMVNKTDQPGVAKEVRHMGPRCPSGRLIVWDKKTQEPLEPALQPSIGLVQDPAAGVSGPLWVRGGIAVQSADGTEYEIRNRVTLCRCGQSSNKPFCDGSHIDARFQDGLASRSVSAE